MGSVVVGQLVNLFSEMKHTINFIACKKEFEHVSVPYYHYKVTGGKVHFSSFGKHYENSAYSNIYWKISPSKTENFR